MTDDNAELFQKVTAQLSKMTAPQYRGIPITRDTEIYRDLRLHGDEIVEFVWWLEREFGVQPNINPFAYAPREFPFFAVLNKLREVAGIQSAYKSLTVRDIIFAIEAKRWSD